MTSNYPVVDKKDEAIHAIISAVWDRYKSCNAWGLSNITHEPNSPWSKAWKRGAYSPLDDEDIKERSMEGIIKRFNNDVGESLTEVM